MDELDQKTLTKHLSRTLLERDLLEDKLNERKKARTFNENMKLYDEEFVDRLIHERNQFERQLKDALEIISKLTKS